ncbi:1-acyl-sn-glycerol-3-phosphate acyltransferase [Rhodonellum sp.]|uniref:lysophospholipid acyltransferase family protein n=1 Tax=Rhodonellum sp. TaxID=2231180 RepID=UPI002718B332|nr:lysophospholipid acyltransferase family protein [Rhodonellum sp.]MDO9554053.1 lysophospholipid acyltransferase family protein [Rhodonellum sp.]
MKIIRSIYTLYAVLLFILLMLVFGLFIVLPLLISPRGGKISFFFLRVWAILWSFLIGIRFRTFGTAHIDLNQAYIYIFNHRSFLDAPLIPMTIKQELRGLGKKELSKIPIFGLIISRVAVWVDRKDSQSRKASLTKMQEILQQGISIIVAPEGTRNDTDKTLLPFQKGAFRLAIDTQTPILPMAVIGADKLLPKGSLLLRPGVIEIYFSAPILPTSLKAENPVEHLSEKCYSRLEAMILTHE